MFTLKESLEISRSSMWNLWPYLMSYILASILSGFNQKDGFDCVPRRTNLVRRTHAILVRGIQNVKVYRVDEDEADGAEALVPLPLCWVKTKGYVLLSKYVRSDNKGADPYSSYATKKCIRNHSKVVTVTP